MSVLASACSAQSDSATTVPKTNGMTARHWGDFVSSTPNFWTTLASPTTVKLPGRVIQIASSNAADYALLANGSVYAWGIGNEGELGDGKAKNSRDLPVKVRFPSGVIVASLPGDAMPYNTGMAIDTKGHAWGWGLNVNGELCLGENTEHLTPVRLPFANVTAMAGAGDHGLFDSNGTVYGCGGNGAGDLGDGTTKPSNVPVRVKDLPVGRVRELVASWDNSGALLDSGMYFDWGYNGQGQLGIGTLHTPSSVPVRVPLPLPVTQVALGGSLDSNGQSLVMLSDGTLRGWGDDQYGQIGDHGSGVRPSPVVFSPPTGVKYKFLASGAATSYAVSTTGAVYSWGATSFGAIGNGKRNKVRELAPIMVQSETSQISATAKNVVTR